MTATCQGQEIPQLNVTYRVGRRGHTCSFFTNRMSIKLSCSETGVHGDVVVSVLSVTVSAQHLRDLGRCSADHVTVSRWLLLPVTAVAALRLTLIV